MHEIKQNIPVPLASNRARSGPKPIYPFADMADGQCFDTPIREDESAEAAVKRMRTTSSSYRGRHKSAMTFIVRAVEDEQTGKQVVRVWARASVPPVKRKLEGGALVNEFFGS